MALFRGAGVGGFTREHVLVSRSTAGLRGLLQEQGIAYRMPLLARREAVPNAAEALDDLRHAAEIGRVQGPRDQISVLGNMTSFRVAVGCQSRGKGGRPPPCDKALSAAC